MQEQNFRLPSSQQWNAIYDWYEKHKRALVFRYSKNPYAVYVSEVMLQQTRAASMQTYYSHFMHKFPSIESLATARLSTVLRYWSGLGYYRRAHNLHRSAKIIVKQYSGKVPHNKNELLALPGIGEYTARAILSLSFQIPVAVCDANVKRVLLRYYYGCEKKKNSEKHLPVSLQTLADAWLREGCQQNIKPGLHNQAMMEFGAMLCKPANPCCEICFLHKHCATYLKIVKKNSATLSNNKVFSFRSPKTKKINTKTNNKYDAKQITTIQWHSFLIQNQNASNLSKENFLVMKSQGFPFLQEYWHFPYRIVLPKQASHKQMLNNAFMESCSFLEYLLQYISTAKATSSAKTQPLLQFHHRITRYHIIAKVFLIEQDVLFAGQGGKSESLIKLEHKVSVTKRSLKFMNRQSNINKKIVSGIINVI